ncbi:MAG TPA: lyase family protein [Pseudolysinimonas sp.]|nr:lyase family protein [Pseudolysinimonas sp.]
MSDWGLLDPLAVESAATADDAVLTALVDAERALLRAWGSVGDAPADLDDIAAALDADAIDRVALLDGSRRGGVPVIALVTQLRAQAGAVRDGAAAWVHRGATSQDILDTALSLVADRGFAGVRRDLLAAGDRLAALADAERGTLAAARTLTQHAAPTTIGAVAASWLDGVCSAIEAVDATATPVQLAGAVGTGEAFDVLAGRAVHDELRRAFAAELSLADPQRSWQVERSPVLAIAGTAALVVAALGRIGRDLALLARTELGEVSLASAGGSSAMPQKQNPVDAVLLTANALRAPGELATVHTAAVSADQRPAGEWHAEWLPLRALLRMAEQSAAVAAAAFAGLTVHHDAVARDLALTGDALLEERVAAGGDPADPAPTMTAAGRTVDAAIARFGALRSPGVR